MNRSRNISGDGKKLPLVEHFYSVQGEGFHTGKPAYFIRIGGCDIGCKWCDTKFSWNKDIHLLTDTGNIIDLVVNCPAKALVVTGGEPLMYNLDFLCSELKKKNIQTFLESSGNHPLSGEWDWICLSPKKSCPPDKEILLKANEIKVIISESSDLDWAETNAQLVNADCKLYLQPEWSRYKKIIHRIVDYSKENPMWNISLQAHKFMKIP